MLRDARHSYDIRGGRPTRRIFSMLLLALCFSLLSPACGAEESNPFILIPYIPPTSAEADMGGGDAGSAPITDPIAEDRPTCESLAEACLLPGGVGACVDGRCRLVVCEEGRGDCDGDPTNGCEVDLTSSLSCGSCFETCSELQSCQRSVTGFACSVGVVCEAGRFDLDARQETGCEIETLALDGAALAQPIALGMSLTERVALAPSNDEDMLESILAFEGFVVGFDGEGARVVHPPGQPSQDPFVLLSTPPSTEPFFGHSLSMDLLTGRDANGSATVYTALDVWEDAAYFYRKTASQGFELRTLELDALGCEEGASLTLRDGVIREGASSSEPTLELVTSLGLFGLSHCEASGPSLCLDAEVGFHGADYLRWFYPYEDDAALASRGAHAPASYRLDPEEVASCQQCVVDTTSGALMSSRACYVSAFEGCGLQDSAPCEGVCESPAVACPDFEVQAVKFSAVSERHYVVTRRGLVVLRHDGQVWIPLARVEREWDASSVGGGRFLDVAITREGDHERLFLLHGTGHVRVLDVSLAEPVQITPAHPDVFVSIGDLDGRGPLAIEALDARTFLLVDPYQATLFYLRDQFDQGRAVIELERDLSSGVFLGATLLETGAALFSQEFGLTRAIFAGRR